MAKTIKELSEIHAPINKEDSWDKTQKQILKQTSFECGANAVLEIIEKELPKSDKILNDYGKALLWRINERIKELKG